MEEIKNTITEEEMEEVIKVTEEINKNNKPIQEMREAREKPIEELVDSNEEKEKRVRMQFNPETGMVEGSSIASDYGADSDKTLFEDLKPMDYTPEDFSDESIKKSLRKEIRFNEDISLEDLNEIRKLLVKKSKDNVKFSELPKFIQEEINKFIMSKASYMSQSRIKEVRAMITNDLMDAIINDSLQDNLSKAYIDLDTSIKNTIKKEGTAIQKDQYHTYYNTFVNKFPEMAKEKEKGNPEQAKILMDVSEGFKQAHSLENMYKAFCSKGYMKIKKIDIEKIHKRIRDFNIKYNNTHLTINDISGAVDILARHVNQRFDINTVKGLIVSFCNYTYNMTPDNIAEHTFMYYFVFNILSLDVPLTNEEDIKWRDEFIENVNHFLSAIDERLKKW